MTPSRALARWRALSPRERILLPLLMLALPVVSLLLKRLGYRRTRSLLERFCSNRPIAPAPNITRAELAHAQRLARLIAIAGRRGPIKTTCLRQALLLHVLLRRRGLPSQLLLGVRRISDSPPEMHAWVELNGLSLDPSSAPAKPFTAVPLPPRTPCDDA